MKNLIYFLLILIAFTSCSHSHVVITDNEIPEEVFYLADQLKPFSGECIIYFDNTEIVKEKMTFKKGILHGTMTSYYKNGNIRRQGTFVDGKIEGKWDSWYQNGKKQYTAYFSNDTLNGEYMEWYATGVMKEKGLYAQNKPEGSWVEYDEAGMIISNKYYGNK